MLRVYLAGGMEGLSREQMTAWRTTAKEKLKAAGVKSLDPTAVSLGGNPTSAVIVQSNKFAIRNSMVVLAEVEERNPVSIGTIGEIVYAFHVNKPVIIFGKGARKNHPWLVAHAAVVKETLDEAIEELLCAFGVYYV